MSKDANRTVIHYLRRHGWTLRQIEQMLGLDSEAIAALLRAPQPTPAGVHASSRDSQRDSDRLRLRLRSDAQVLEIFLPVDALTVPTEILLQQIQAECDAWHIPVSLTLHELTLRMRAWVYGTWLAVKEAIPPTPPVHARVQFLVPVRTTGQWAAGPEIVVPAGTALACLEPGRPGRPGRDLLGRVIPAKPIRVPSMPQGANTHLSDDGHTLRATCDGEVVLHFLRIHVMPITVHEGDLTQEYGPLRPKTRLRVTGSVSMHARIEATRSVLIEGAVDSAHIISTKGSVEVRGGVRGSVAKPSRLQAPLDIRCTWVAHAHVHAGRDIILRKEARTSRLEAARNLVLTNSLEESLIDVRLVLGGGVVVPVPPIVLPDNPPAERQYTRIPMALPAELAIHGEMPLMFTACTIADLSPGGARCLLATPLPVERVIPTTIFQLKFALPGRDSQIIVIGRFVRVPAAGEVAMAFIQITARDADRVMSYYLEHLRATSGIQGSRSQRKSTSP